MKRINKPSIIPKNKETYATEVRMRICSLLDEKGLFPPSKESIFEAVALSMPYGIRINAKRGWGYDLFKPLIKSGKVKLVRKRKFSVRYSYIVLVQSPGSSVG